MRKEEENKQLSLSKLLLNILIELQESEYVSEKLKAVSPFAAAAYEGDLATLGNADLETIKTDYLLHFAVVGAIRRDDTNALKYLLTAIEKINPSVTEYLEANDIHINPIPLGCTPLWIACCEGDIKVVRLLLTNAEIDVNQSSRHRTPLWIASLQGHTEVVRLLLDKLDVDVNQANENGETPLSMACKNGHAEVVRLLLNSPGIDVNQSNDVGETPLGIACSRGHTEVVQLLLNSPGIDVNQPNNVGETPLRIACSRGHAEVVQLLLNNPGVDVNQLNYVGYSPLWAACENGHAEVVRLLLNAGANLDQAENSKFNANQLLTKLINARENLLSFTLYPNEDRKSAKLLELNKIAYLLCTLPKDNPIGRNWDMNNETLAAMVRKGFLAYARLSPTNRSALTAIFFGKQENVTEKTFPIRSLPLELLFEIAKWVILSNNALLKGAWVKNGVLSRMIGGWLKRIEAVRAAAPKTSTQEDTETTQTSTAGAQVTTVSALLANSTVATTATPTARDATAEEKMAAADNATAGPSSS